MRISPKIFLLCLLLVAPLGQLAHGLQVTGLYSHRIAVANESEAERNRAFREAFAAVILKVTGQTRWLEHPAITQAQGRAQNFVEAIAYSSETVLLPAPEVVEPVEPVEPDPDAPPVDDQPPPVRLPTTMEQRYIEVNFAAALVDELLSSAGIPIWGSNRPSVLVWMVLQDPDGARHMLTADSDPEVLSLIRSLSADRGLPVIFPVLDFEDRRNLPVDTVWSLDEVAIRQASQRYGADSVLSGRLLFTATGELVGLWQFIFQDNVIVFDGLDTDLESYLNAPVSRIANDLAGFFAILPTDSMLYSVRLRVDGIDDLDAYAGLLNYVGSLGLVETITTAAVDGERLELDLKLEGDVQQLSELIALDRDLLPIASSLAGDDPTLLHYRWTR